MQSGADIIAGRKRRCFNKQTEQEASEYDIGVSK